MNALEQVIAAIENQWDTTFDAPISSDPKFVAEVLQIAASLDGLFRNTDTIRDWLREPQDALAGEAPLDHIERRGIGGAQLIREFTDFLSGR